MIASLKLRRLASLASVLAVTASISEAQTVFSAAGAGTASIQTTVDSYRAALGTLNLNNGSAFASGRREINWDAVPVGFSSPNALPGNFFSQTFNGSNGGRTRGAVFSAPTGGFLVSSDSTDSNFATNQSFQVELANSNVAFPRFSNDQVFLAGSSTVMDVTFTVPGTGNVSAFVTGFGVVFMDVEAANTTSLEFFDLNNNSVGSFFAPAGGPGEFSFLGVDYSGVENIGRVRITSGSETLSAFAPGSSNRESIGDLVAMDDFFYSEPQSTSAIPEPSSFAAIAGVMALAGTSLRRRRATSAV